MKKEYYTKQFIKLIKFLIAGLPAFIIAVPLNYLLVKKLNFYQPIAYAIVLIIQVTINFFMCRWIVFKERKKTSLWLQFIQFFSGIGLFRLLDWGIYVFAVEVLDIYFIAVQLFNICFFAIVKFKFSQIIMEHKAARQLGKL